MLRPCPRCGNRNHISDPVCECGFQLFGAPSESQTALTVSSQNTFSANSFVSPKPPASRETAAEMQKRAIREALLVEESESSKPASGKFKVNLKKTFAGVISVIAIGALLALFGGFTKITENSADEREEKKRFSVADTSFVADSRYLTANNSGGETSVVGKVVDVGSGDTITVADNYNREHRIKLEGIDAPELEQDFGRKSQANLFALVFGKTVQANLRKSGDDDLTVGKVLLNGKNVSLEQLKTGSAWHDKRAAFEQSENELFADNQAAAKGEGLGLWTAANPIPPWKFRRASANLDQIENQATVADKNREIPKNAPNVAEKTKTTVQEKIIVQEKTKVAKNEVASTKIASRTAYIKSVKPLTSSSIPPSPKVLVIVPANNKRKVLSAPVKAPIREKSYIYRVRVGDCFIIEGGKKVYLDRAICGN